MDMQHRLTPSGPSQGSHREIEDISSPPEFRALVVDDQEVSRAIVRHALESVHIRCDEATDGAEALGLLLQRRYDLLVCDLVMPNMHGHALIRQVQRQPDPPRIIVLTGLEEPRILRDLARRGVAAVLFKPTNGNTIAETATKVLSQHPPSRPRQPVTARRSHRQSADENPRVSHGPADAAESSGFDGASESGNRGTGRVVILLNDRTRAERLAQVCSTDAVLACVASGAEDLHRLLQREPMDLLVIEDDLQGLLTGSEIVERLARNGGCPTAILLAATHGENAHLTHPEIKAIVSPERPPAEIAALVRSLCTAHGSARVLVPQAARQLVQQHSDLAPVPQLLVQLTTYLSLDAAEIPLTQLAKDISVDPRATADLLRLTNSASVGLRRRITSVFDAVTLLGGRRSISLVCSSAAIATQAELLSQWSEPLRKWYHQRSLLIASTAAAFAERLEQISPDTAFVLGLLQDVGILVLARAFAPRYETILQRVRTVGQLQLPLIEQEDLGVSHGEVSAALLQHWQLPPTLVAPVLGHHQPDHREQSASERGYLRVMRIGEALANLVDHRGPVRQKLLNRLLGEYGRSQWQECRNGLSEAVARTIEAGRIFTLPVPEAERLDRLVECLQSECLEEPDPSIEQETVVERGIAEGRHRFQENANVG